MSEFKPVKDWISSVYPSVFEAIKTATVSGVWAPEPQEWQQRLCKDFLYDEVRQGPSGYETKFFSKLSWAYAVSRVAHEFASTEIAKSARAKLELLKPDFQPWVFDAVIRDLIGAAARLEGAATLDVIEQRLINYLSDAPVLARTIARAQGLVILAGPVVLPVPGGKVTFRAITKEEFEKPRLVERYLPFGDFGLEEASATIDVEVTTLDQNDGQNILEKTKFVLGLYDACSVSVLEYSMSSDSYGRFMLGGRVFSGRSSVKANRPLVLKEASIGGFREFWKIIWPLLPAQLLSRKDIGPASVALTRYSEACVEPRTPEYSIATTMMGLEGLYAEGSPEISYRLRQRVARVMGCLGLPAQAVHAAINDGYGVRSILVHGGSIGHKEKKKYSKLYGNLEQLLKLNLSLLRITILLWLLTAMEKDRFLDLVDEAMFDDAKNAELRQIIQPQRDHVGVWPSFS